MLVLITYDVETTDSSGQKRLRNVAKVCQNYGQRVQNSVFECIITEDLYIKIKSQLFSIIDKDRDSIRFYLLGNNYIRRIEHLGVQTAFDMTGELII